MEKLMNLLKEKGLKLVEKTNEVVNQTKDKIKQTLLNDQLKRRFQLENPKKFVVNDSIPKVNLIDELTAWHAKTYEEDLIFVFYGQHLEELKVGSFVKDLGTLEVFKIKEVAEVQIPVTYQDELHDVSATAVYCEEV